MRPHRPTFPERLLVLLACALVLKTVAKTVLDYQHYFPADFNFDFLRGREPYFRGVYWWAFYTHILSGPVALLLGLILVVERSRPRFPAWHRRLGWLQVGCVLLLVTPSGLWMAYYAAAGPVAAVSLAALAIATAVCVVLGARSAMMRKFAAHRIWMWRCYVLLCSAVVLRVIGGLSTVMGAEAAWVDPLATWMSWLAPLSAFELYEWTRRRSRSFQVDRPRDSAARESRVASVQ
jgi:hypothetical protein